MLLSLFFFPFLLATSGDSSCVIPIGKPPVLKTKAQQYSVDAYYGLSDRQWTLDVFSRRIKYKGWNFFNVDYHLCKTESSYAGLKKKVLQEQSFLKKIKLPEEVSPDFQQEIQILHRYYEVMLGLIEQKQKEVSAVVSSGAHSIPAENSEFSNLLRLFRQAELTEFERQRLYIASCYDECCLASGKVHRDPFSEDWELYQVDRAKEKAFEEVEKFLKEAREFLNKKLISDGLSVEQIKKFKDEIDQLEMTVNQLKAQKPMFAIQDAIDDKHFSKCMLYSCVVAGMTMVGLVYYFYYCYETGSFCNFSNWLTQTSVHQKSHFTQCGKQTPATPDFVKAMSNWVHWFGSLVFSKQNDSGNSASVADVSSSNSSLELVESVSQHLSRRMAEQSNAREMLAQGATMTSDALWGYLQTVPGLYQTFIQLFGLPVGDVCSALQNNATLTLQNAVKNYTLAGAMTCVVRYLGGSLLQGACSDGGASFHWVSTPEVNAQGVSCGSGNIPLLPGHLQMGFNSGNLAYLSVLSGVAPRTFTPGQTITPELRPHRRSHSGSEEISVSPTDTDDQTGTGSEITKRTGSPSGDETDTFSTFTQETGSAGHSRSPSPSFDETDSFSTFTHGTGSPSKTWRSPSLENSQSLSGELMMYFANRQNSTIDWTRIDGSTLNLNETRVLVQGNSSYTNQPNGIYVDSLNRNMYWSDAPGHVYFGAIDPANPMAPLSVQKIMSNAAQAIFIDLLNNYMYFGAANFLKVGSINASAPAVPTGIVTLSGSSAYNPLSIHVDVVNGKIYVVDQDTGEIWVCDINPQNPVNTTNCRQISSTGGGITAMSILESLIYWVTGVPNPVLSVSNLNRSTSVISNTTVISTDSQRVMGNNAGGIFMIKNF